MKMKRSAKILCCAMSMLVVLGAVDYSFLAAAARPADGSEKVSPLSVAEAEAAGTALDASEKEETVYVFSGADGAVDHILVSNWLKNPNGVDLLKDVTALTDLENVEGDDVPSVSSNGSCIWAAGGKDVYYQGASSASLPVSLAVAYTLDGKTMTPDELAGKSGKITITYTFTNTQCEMRSIGGKDQKIYVPFVALTGMLLDNDRFSNVAVTNGKVLNDGDHTAVIGLALPGLQESLGLSRDTVDLPDTVTLTADVTDFSLEGVYAVVADAGEADTAKLDEKLDDKKVDTGDIKDLLNTLTQAVTQLADGSQQLADGLDTLNTKSQELASGVSQLASGAGSLASGASALQSGLGTLNGKSAELTGGAYQVFQQLCAAANSQLAANGVNVSLTPENYVDTLNAILQQAGGVAYQQAEAKVRAAVNDAVKAKVTAGVNAQADAIYVQYVVSQMTDAQKAGIFQQAAALGVKQAVLAATPGMTEEQADGYLATEAGQQAIAGAVQNMTDANKQAALTAAGTQVAAGLSDEQKAQILAGAVAQTMALETTKATIEENVSAQMNSDTVKQQIQAGLNSDPSYQALLSLKSQLDQYNTFYAGVQAYTAGVGEAYNGINQVASGAAQLSAGAGKLQSGCAALISGVGQLKEGADTLNAGMKEFSDTLLGKLSSASAEELEDLAPRVEALKEVGKNYQSYDSIAKNTKGTVRFLYKIADVVTDKNA